MACIHSNTHVGHIHHHLKNRSLCIYTMQMQSGYDQFQLLQVYLVSTHGKPGSDFPRLHKSHDLQRNKLHSHLAIWFYILRFKLLEPPFQCGI